MAIVVGTDRKAQIRDIAQNLFRERGYAATSMRDLAKAVGIEPASLYSHIASKESILRDICFSMADEFFTELNRVDDGLSSDARLKEAIIGHIRVIRRNYDAAAVFLHEWRFLEEPNLSRFKHLRKQYEERFWQILDEGQHKGVFRPIERNIVLPTLFSSMNWAYEYIKPAAMLAPEEIGGAIWRLFFRGLQAQSIIDHKNT